MPYSDSEILGQLRYACYGNIPADKEYYQDCQEVRGGGDVIKSMMDHLSPGSRPCLLFTGHIGCGKSSELLEFERRLVESRKQSGLKSLFVVRYRLLDYLNEFNVSSFDILITLISALEDELQKHNIKPERSSIIQRVREFFNPKIQSADVNLGMLKLQLRTQDANKLEDLRKQFKAENTTLTQEFNTLLQIYRAEIVKRGYEDFLFILDDLEKIQQVDGKEDMVGWEQLFINEANKFTTIEAPMICTIPLVLARRSGNNLKQAYGGIRPFVLPMVKVTERDGIHPYDAGVEQMSSLLSLRLGGKAKIEEVFEETALKRLIHYSGGHFRDFIGGVWESCMATDKLPITNQAVNQWISGQVQMLMPTVEDGWWESMANLELDPFRAFDLSNIVNQNILDAGLVMEYLNGDSNHDVFDNTLWYAVHPILRETKRFKSKLTEARIRLQANITTPIPSESPKLLVGE